MRAPTACRSVYPNGTPSYSLATSRLDFVKAFVTITAKAGVTLKVGREQADGIDIGMSRKFASASDYATVLRSFDLASLRWDVRKSSVMGVVGTPVDNQPYGFNQRRPGELFWALQATHTTGRNAHRLYLARRSTDANGPTSETGVRGESDTYVLGFQELGPLLVPGLTWEVDSIVEWGDRATDRVRAAAIFATATHAFNPDQSVFVGYHQGTGDGHRGGGTTHLYDTLYSSGFNNYGYMGLSQGRNIGDVRIGGRSKIKGPVVAALGLSRAVPVGAPGPVVCDLHAEHRSSRRHLVAARAGDRRHAAAALPVRPAHDDRPQLPRVLSPRVSQGHRPARAGAAVRDRHQRAVLNRPTPHPCGCARPVPD